MVELKAWIIPVAGLIPLVIGFIWYNPKVMGNAWMYSAGLNEGDLKGGKTGLIYFLSYVFSCMIGFVLMNLSVHQSGFNSMVLGSDESTMAAAKALLVLAEDNYRTFKHGVFHGIIAGLFFAFPLLAINALFERKGWKYIWINASYWIISFALMGGVICEFA